MSYGQAKLDGPLTKRQLEVMWLVAEGLTNKEIAVRLRISESSVKGHIDIAIKKLGVSNRTGAAVRFVLEGVPQLPMPHVELLRALSVPASGRAASPSAA